MTEINDNTPCVGGGWRGVRDALAKRDRFHKFLTKGHPDGVMLPYYGGGDIRYYWLNLKRESEFPIPWGTWTKIFDDYRDLVPPRLRPEAPKRRRPKRPRKA
jgi:hypothetical protein